MKVALLAVVLLLFPMNAVAQPDARPVTSLVDEIVQWVIDLFEEITMPESAEDSDDGGDEGLPNISGMIDPAG